MKNWLIAFLLTCHVGVHADSWLPAAVLIPAGASSEVDYNVTTVYDPVNEITVAAWADDSGDYPPIYAIYDGASWTTPGTLIPIGTSSGVSYDVSLIYNSTNKTIVATWKDSIVSYPFYAVFDGSSWITPGSPIAPGLSAGAKSNINLTYNQANNTVIAAWGDSSTSLAYYSVFDGSNWTVASLLPIGITSTGVRNDVLLTYDEANKNVIAAWSDEVTQLPYYSVLNGAIWTVPGFPIPVGTSSGVNDNVTLVYYPTFKTVIAAWGDTSSSLPFFAIYNGTNWVNASGIPQGTSQGAYGNINMAFDSDSKTIVAAWNEEDIYLPYSSVFNGTFWSTRAIPYTPSAGTNYDVWLSYNESAHQMVATWGQYPGNADPYYQIYTIEVSPVTDLGACSFYNKFASQKVWVNRLEWTASSSTFVDGYNIYRNGVLIGQVDSKTFAYTDQGRCKGKNYTYGVAARTSGGLESAIAIIELP